MGIKLIALMALSAIVLIDGTTQDVADGAEFEVSQTDADQLIAQGKAKLVEPAAKPAADPVSKVKQTKVRLLTDCDYGRTNDVVTLSSAEAKEAEKQGIADSNKDAVAYAQTLPQNNP